MTDTTGATSAAQDLVLTREFDSPRELVWRAWSEPEHFARWFGPRGYTIPHCEIDFRVGGRIFYAMRSPEEKDIWATGVFKEIVPLEGSCSRIRSRTSTGTRCRRRTTA